MSDEVVLQGKTFVSSKRAAEETGYARDYIGQLARGGQIEAERVGGLWYVSLESLRGYELNADSAKMMSVATLQPRESESSLSFEGRDYISASRASKITGYNQDYVGQLARASKIPSRQIGNRWYVDRDALVAHKTEKDSLLAAVQTESVGLKRPEPVAALVAAATDRVPAVSTQYMREEKDLMPVINKIDVVGAEPLPALHTPPERSEIEHIAGIHVEKPHLVTPRILPDIRPIAVQTVRKSLGEKPLIPLTPRSHRGIAIRAGFGVLTIILFVSVGMATMRNEAVIAAISSNSLGAAATTAFDSVFSALENVVSPELTYDRDRDR